LRPSPLELLLCARSCLEQPRRLLATGRIGDLKHRVGRRGIRLAIRYLALGEAFTALPTMGRLLTAEEIADRLGMKTQWISATSRPALQKLAPNWPPIGPRGGLCNLCIPAKPLDLQDIR
jgi:hypothetical protein